MAKITYEDKVFINENADVPEINKITDNNLNEIKKVVNKNDNNVGDLSSLNTDVKDNLVNAINNVNKKSLLKISKSSKSSFQLGNYGFTKIPLDVEEIKVGDKFALQDGSIVNVSGKTLNVRVYFVCTASSAIQKGYMLVGKNDEQGVLSPFVYAQDMNSCSELTTILQLDPNDKLYMKIGINSSTSVEVNRPTFIAVEEI